ncbi:hypothetical protein AAY473_039350 [Plecturocebus cupreus]
MIQTAGLPQGSVTSGDPFPPIPRDLLCSCHMAARAQRRGFHHVGQAALELLTSSNPAALASQSAGITGMVAHACNPSTWEARMVGSRGQAFETSLANICKGVEQKIQVILLTKKHLRKCCKFRREVDSGQNYETRFGCQAHLSPGSHVAGAQEVSGDEEEMGLPEGDGLLREASGLDHCPGAVASSDTSRWVQVTRSSSLSVGCGERRWSVGRMM